MKVKDLRALISSMEDEQEIVIIGPSESRFAIDYTSAVLMKVDTLLVLAGFEDSTNMAESIDGVEIIGTTDGEK